jgi:uncharacterized protein YndB with AHSA1/START domain
MSATATQTKTIGQLKVTTPSDREIAMTRVFDAPRSRVFDAYTKPELIKRWMGPRGWSLTIADIDLKEGGAYRFVGRGANRKDMGWGGIYREIARPERLVVTEKFDQPWYPGEAVITTVLTEQGGKTTLTATGRYESREARDAVLNTGMERGLAESYDRLEELLASTPAR